MIRISLLGCGVEYSGVQKDITESAEKVGARIIYPEISTDDILAAEKKFGLSVASNNLKMMIARAISVGEGRTRCDGVLIATCFRCAEGALVRGAVRKYLESRVRVPIITYSFTEYSQAGTMDFRMEALSNLVSLKSLLAKTKQDGVSAGIDSGSSMTKAVVMKDDQVIGTGWVPSTNVINSAKDAYARALTAAGVKETEIEALGITGQGKDLVKSVFKAQLVQEEVTVCAKGAAYLAKKFTGDSTVIDVGGMYNKAITLHDGIPSSFAIGALCAGASGRFLEVTASKIGSDLDDFGEIASKGNKAGAEMNSYCIVLGMHDLVSSLGSGSAPPDVAAAACYSVAEQVFEHQLQEVEIYDPVILVGGSSVFKGLAYAFKEILSTEIVVPPYSAFMGAVGAALLASGLKENGVG